MSRKVRAYPFIIPKSWVRQNTASNPSALEMFSIIGHNSAIRFFDENSRQDYQELRQIMESRMVREWMDDAGRISWSDYQDWAGNDSNESFLFAVHDIRQESMEEIRKIRGFVNFYSERSEKFRVKRLIKAGLLNKSDQYKNILEISMAVRPLENGEHTGSGLMSAALRQSCLQVKELIGKKNQDIIITSFIDPQNVASVRTMEAAGFIKRGVFRYDSNSEDESRFYTLSWKKLNQIIKNKMLLAIAEGQDKKAKIILEPQITDSHCGPAVVKGLLQYQKIDVDQNRIVLAARVKGRIMKYGMRPSQIYRAVKKLAPNMKLLFKENANRKDLETLIYDYKLPVGIDWQGLFYDTVAEEKKLSPYDDHGHYSIVIDIKPEIDKIVIDDPYSEYFTKPRTFSFRWFKSRWWDNDNWINKRTKTKYVIETKKMIFVVVPKEMKLPKRLHLKSGRNLVKMEKVEAEAKI